MFLSIDIGNTTTKFGVFEKDLLIKRLTIPTIRSKNASEIKESIGNELDFNFDSVISSSVVPELNDAFAELSQDFFNSQCHFASHDFDYGFGIEYEPRENLGIDRLVAAYGAVEQIGKPCIVCDFGTATTIDAVSSKGVFLGGIITAGMNLIADALHQKTSKLPKIELRIPEKAIGNSTLSAIQSGVYFGYIGLVDGLIRRISDEMGEKAKVIATGGLASLIAKGSKSIKMVDDGLMLKALHSMHKKLA